MSEFHEAQIAFLRGKELPLNLIEFYGRVSIHLGSAAFSLLQHNDEPVVCLAEQQAGYDHPLSLRVADLSPGNSVRIGRQKGIEIFDREGERDNEKLQQIWDEELHQSLLSDEHLSREHAEVMIVSPSDLIIKDLGSMNGTVVMASNVSPGAKIIPLNIPGQRGRLRLVKPLDDN